MRIKPKFLVCVGFVICGGLVTLKYGLPRLIEHHNEEFKRGAITEIARMSGNDNWVQEQLGLIKQKTNQEDGWLSDHIILTESGEWLVYTNKCSKEDWKMKDTFVGKASDGNWYDSNYHFCIQMVTLRMDEQPKTLVEFISKYDLRRISDENVSVKK